MQRLASRAHSPDAGSAWRFSRPQASPNPGVLNYAAAYQDYLDLLAECQEEGEGDPPEWKEWNTPTLKEPVVQANANVALLQAAEASSFDYWLRLSTLEKGHPVLPPVRLAPYHRQALAGKTLDCSTVLARKADGWWLTLSYDEDITVATPKDAPVIGIDVGIATFLTTSTGKQYGTFAGKRAARHKRDRETRRRKAKLRACLKKKGVQRLPSTRNKKLARHVRQEINRAVNEVYQDHPDTQVAYEQLNVAGMTFKARRMNAYLYASNLAHSPEQLAWGAAKRRVRARKVKECLQFPGVPSLSLCRPREPPQPANVLLRGRRAYQPCRQKCSREPGASSG
jgi:hypothetical protein